MREKRCRLCKRKEEDPRHVIEECEITGGLKDTEKILNETGEGPRTKNNNREEKGNTRRGGATIRKHSKEAKAQKLP